MTHEYTLLVGATVLPGGGAPVCEAMAWAHGTILALGSEAEIRAISRGDSHVLEAPGLFVVPLDAALEIGASADLVVLAGDPRREPAAAVGPGAPVAIIRGGHVVDGELPGRLPGALPGVDSMGDHGH
jgi:predicted amidohydrolase YtcJ